MAKPATAAAALLGDALTAARSGDRTTAMSLLARAHALDSRHVGVRNALGVLRLESGDAAGALALLKPLARELPQAAPIQINYGNALIAAGRAGDAVAPFKRAVAAPDANAMTWYGYGRALQTCGRVAEADAAYVRALELDPAHRDARANRVAVLNFLDAYTDAEAEARAAIEREPHDAGAHLNLAVSLLAQARWREGWQEYEWRGHTALLDGQRRTWQAPAWQGEPLAGRTILVHAEQGFGDTIQFARYVPVLRTSGARVLLQVPATLKTLLTQSALADAVFAFGESLPTYDVQVALTSLPFVLQLDSSASVMGSGDAYLRADSPSASPDLTALWRVGLVWSGSPTHVNDMHRSCGFEAMRPLFDLPDVHFVNLQARDVAGRPTPALPKGKHWTDAAAQLTDFAETARVLRELDLVIAVDSAVAHLAGALGVPCWLLLPRIGLDWRWAAERAGEPVWYRSMRTFRQREPDQWRDTLVEVREALRGHMTDKRNARVA